MTAISPSEPEEAPTAIPSRKTIFQLTSPMTGKLVTGFLFKNRKPPFAEVAYAPPEKITRAAAIEFSAGQLRQLLEVAFEDEHTLRILLREAVGLDVDVELAEEPFAHGTSVREFVVPANGEAEFDMLVTANAAAALLKIAGEGGKADAIPYTLKGKLSTRLGLLRSVPFEESGTLPIADLLGKR